MWLTTTRRPLEAGDITLRRLNRMFDELSRAFPYDQEGTAAMTSSWAPACDIFEDKDGIRIVAEIPGVNPGDVKISLENNTLTLRGEKKQVAEETTERVHRYERSYGSFERTFALPTTVDPDRIEAHYEQGLLTVSLPKVEKARPREIPVAVK
ncbi:MAG: Hsp20/alpha crystallin family protein [Gemmatimonadales bacterium]